MNKGVYVYLRSILVVNFFVKSTPDIFMTNFEHGQNKGGLLNFKQRL